MRTIAKLFGRSPFGPLQSHMDTVANCVHKLPELFAALESGEWDKVRDVSDQISQLEHAADRVKNDIRNNLPKRMFLPVDRGSLLELLAVQDALADNTENVGILLTLRQLVLLEDFRDQFHRFLLKNLEAFEAARGIIGQLDELVESSFGGPEADKVKNMVEDVAFKEHEADVIQRELVRALFASESQMTYGQFHLWNQVFEEVASLSNLAEKLANRLRMTLELK